MDRDSNVCGGYRLRIGVLGVVIPWWRGGDCRKKIEWGWRMENFSVVHGACSSLLFALFEVRIRSWQYGILINIIEVICHEHDGIIEHNLHLFSECPSLRDESSCSCPALKLC